MVMVMPEKTGSVMELLSVIEYVCGGLASCACRRFGTNTNPNTTSRSLRIVNVIAASSISNWPGLHRATSQGRSPLASAGVLVLRGSRTRHLHAAHAQPLIAQV